jgi:hypothetical protein
MTIHQGGTVTVHLDPDQHGGTTPPQWDDTAQAVSAGTDGFNGPSDLLIGTGTKD